MAIMGCSLDESESFSREIEKLRRKINDNEEFRQDLLHQGDKYRLIKEYFRNFTSFLRYNVDLLSCGNFYRVRKIDGCKPYSSRRELIYPEPNVEHKDRMNNSSFRVLYTSFHEFTAMAESRIGKEFIDQPFQLTRFTTERTLKIYRLGLFSELYLNTPRDSDSAKNQMMNFLDSDFHDRTVQGYSALECAMADVLYDQSDGYHYLSSLLADAIFSDNSEIDAIAYPSMQNRYGINLAFRKECTDSMRITYSSLNRVKKVYKNGFYKYTTEMECQDFSNSDNFPFILIKRGCCFR